ncbi:hypothetical protein D081_1650 [Anaerovibrio sp. JC8]|uniref:Ltp family lipoprotein n=1 Tax=Anaerovibrio sp. JC8 TaxID=1240085 RepID=UPI000A0E2505|nr:Ltp family lipoprotein [Anaerovibrio sp. JC8]ORT99766.1 hypothetical protein D081_1650 [Anaerovibrio sp. JC8]
METFRGTGEYTVSDNETLQQAEDSAVKEALRDISEQVGVVVSSNTKVENAVVTHDEIVTFSSSFVKVLDKKIERHIDDDGDIHITARITGNADPDLVLTELKHLSTLKSPQSGNATSASPIPSVTPQPITPQPVIIPQPTQPNTQPSKTIPPEYQGALQQAKAYSLSNHLSKKGLFKYMLNNGYPRNIATMISENADIDWKNNALNRASDYLTTGYYSKNGIYTQLLSPNEGFTREEAFYAMTNVVADWQAQALGKARQYKEMGWSNDKINQRLLVEGFAKNEVQYAVSLI